MVTSSPSVDLPNSSRLLSNQKLTSESVVLQNLQELVLSLVLEFCLHLSARQNLSLSIQKKDRFYSLLLVEQQKFYLQIHQKKEPRFVYLVPLLQRFSPSPNNHSVQSRYLENLQTYMFQTILVLVRYLHLLVLQKQLDSTHQISQPISSSSGLRRKHSLQIHQKKEPRSDSLEIQLLRFSPSQSNHLVRSLYLEMQQLQGQETLLDLVLSERFLVLPSLSHSTQKRSKCSSPSRVESQAKSIPKSTLVWIHQSEFAEVHSATSRLTIGNLLGYPKAQFLFMAKLQQFFLQPTLDLVLSERSLVQQNLLPSIQTRSRCSSPSQENWQKEQLHLMLARAIYLHSVVEQKELHTFQLFSQTSDSMVRSVFVMYLTTLDLVISLPSVDLLSLSPSTQMRDNYSSPSLVN